MNFAETIDFSKSTKYVWNKTKILKSKWVQPSSFQQSTEWRQEQATIVLGKIVSHLHDDHPPNQPQDFPISNDHFFDSPFDFYEFNSALE